MSETKPISMTGWIALLVAVTSSLVAIWTNSGQFALTAAVALFVAYICWMHWLVTDRD